MKNEILEKLSNCKLLFWDFDGVILNSMPAKARAFEELFTSVAPQEVIFKIKDHHNCNGGLSRYDKIPLYMSWCGIEISKKYIDEYTTQFADISKRMVLQSEWIMGVREFIANREKSFYNVIVTATPLNEIKEILAVLNINKYFTLVYGSPDTKVEGLEQGLKSLELNKNDAYFIGDAIADYNAARECNIKFVLRSSKKTIISKLNAPCISDFRYE